MSGPALTDAQRLDWLRLARTDGVGPRTFRALVNRFGGARAALDALPDLARAKGRRVVPVSLAEAERELAAAAKVGARPVLLGEPGYPRLLAFIADAPPVLMLRGDPAVFARPCVGIVGSRNASALGLRFAERLAQELGEAGFTVVSGLARGIDTAAHGGSLARGGVAVLAGGIDKVYPPQNAGLLERLAEGGAVLAETPTGVEPRGRDFPRRNRIVSGVSYGVVVVEAAARSGSLITARFALEQGREVMAAPGSPLDPRAAGANALLREGATLITEAAHVVEALQPLVGAGAEHEPRPAPRPGTRAAPGLFEEEGGDGALFDEFEDEGPRPPASRGPGMMAWDDALDEGAALPADVRAAVLGLLGPAATSLDELVRRSEAGAREVVGALAELEIEGRVTRRDGGYVLGR